MSPGAEEVDDAVADDAAARAGRVQRQRGGGGAEDRRGVGLEEELAQQVLLQERVRPAQAIARDEEDLRALHGDDRRVRIDADDLELGLEHVVADVAAERRSRERAAPELDREREQALFPELGRGAGADLERGLGHQ